MTDTLANRVRSRELGALLSAAGTTVDTFFQQAERRGSILPGTPSR